MCWRKTVSIILMVVAVAFACDAAAVGANTYYVAPTTTGTADGSIDHPYTSFSTAINKVVAGDTIYVRGGTYNLTSTISIGSGKSGTAANPFSLLAYPGEAPILDFRGETYSATNAGQKGISVSGNYWHIKGLTIQYAADNGLSISGSNNIVEQVIARQNQDSGFLISGSNQPSNNLLLNCDSYGNFDFGAGGENADGFAVKFRGLGSGNVISGARSYDNADDGFDFWQAEHGVTVMNSWSFHNGVASVFNNPAGYQGDGNGIKLGHDSGTHVLENMLIFSNSANGVDINGNATQLEGDPPTTIPHGVTVYNTTAAFNGGKNFQFDENPALASPPTTHTLRNNVSYTGSTTIPAARPCSLATPPITTRLTDQPALPPGSTFPRPILFRQAFLSLPGTVSMRLVQAVIAAVRPCPLSRRDRPSRHGKPMAACPRSIFCDWRLAVI